MFFLLTGKGCNDAATISVAKHVASGHNVAIRQIDLEKADIDYNTLQVSVVLYMYLWQSTWHQDPMWPLDR